MIEKMVEEENIGAKQAVAQIVERWERTGRRPTTDTWRELKGRRLGLLKPKMKEGLNNVVANEWKKVRFCVDSGAGETVMAEEELPEVETKESWGSKRGQSYEVANGQEIFNQGEKRFVAYMATVGDQDSEAQGVTAQICDVHRPLMSVKNMCKSGHKVIFDDEGSYIESKQTGERLKIVEEDGEYLLDLWVKSGGGETTFGGQGK